MRSPGGRTRTGTNRGARSSGALHDSAMTSSQGRGVGTILVLVHSRVCCMTPSAGPISAALPPQLDVCSCVITASLVGASASRCMSGGSCATRDRAACRPCQKTLGVCKAAACKALQRQLNGGALHDWLTQACHRVQACHYECSLSTLSPGVRLPVELVRTRRHLCSERERESLAALYRQRKRGSACQQHCGDLLAAMLCLPAALLCLPAALGMHVVCPESRSTVISSSCNAP